MPTSFQVFSLGQLPVWDTAEGNTTLAVGAVNAALGSYGSAADPLFNDIATFAPAGNGFNGGTPGEYDLDNNDSNDQFSIDGGPPQTFDALMIFNATITFKDGSTANITAVIFQDTVGNTYWAPEFIDNADQALIESQAIYSLTLNSPIFANGSANQGYNMFADRADNANLVCFTKGTLIAVPGGETAVEALKTGDLVETMDHGPQPIRWIGRRAVLASGRFAPVRIRKGAYGAREDLLVSQQHRILLRGEGVRRHFGAHEVLAPAKHLVDGAGADIAPGGVVEYHHILMDRHEVVFANGAPAETLFLGPMAVQGLGADSIREIEALFPDLAAGGGSPFPPARPFPKGRLTREFAKSGLRAAA